VSEKFLCDYFGGTVSDKFPPRLTLAKLARGGFRLSLRGTPKKWEDGFSEPGDLVEIDIPIPIAAMLATQLSSALPDPVAQDMEKAARAKKARKK